MDSIAGVAKKYAWLLGVLALMLALGYAYTQGQRSGELEMRIEVYEAAVDSLQEVNEGLIEVVDSLYDEHAELQEAYTDAQVERDRALEYARNAGDSLQMGTTGQIDAVATQLEDTSALDALVETYETRLELKDDEIHLLELQVNELDELLASVNEINERLSQRLSTLSSIIAQQQEQIDALEAASKKGFKDIAVDVAPWLLLVTAVIAR